MTTQFHDNPMSAAALDQIFNEARTYYGWLDKNMSDADCAAIWDLAKMGPTSANQLPARIVWCRSDEAKAKLAGCASEGNVDKIKAAPVTAIIGMDIDFHEQLPWLYPHTDAKAWFDGDEEGRKVSAMRNSTLQGAYVIIAARALGFDTGPMSGFDNDAVDKAFFADQPRFRSNFICSIGYGDAESLHSRGPRPEFDKFNSIA